MRFLCPFRLYIKKGRITVNQFSELSSIFGPAEAKPPALREFLDQARSIRDRLGGEKSLLGRYLSELFQVLNQKFVYDAAAEGFSAGGVLGKMCAGVLEENPEHAGHPFYGRLCGYILAHPLPGQDEYTKIHTYCALLNDEYLLSTSGRYLKKLAAESDFDMDMPELRELSESIRAKLGGEEEMERLNTLFRRKFILTGILDAFRQGVADQLVCSLLTQSEDASKTVFELLLENGVGAE